MSSPACCGNDGAPAAVSPPHSSGTGGGDCRCAVFLGCPFVRGSHSDPAARLPALWGAGGGREARGAPEPRAKAAEVPLKPCGVVTPTTPSAAKHPERAWCQAALRVPRMLSPRMLFHLSTTTRAFSVAFFPSLLCMEMWRAELFRLWSEGMTRRWLLWTRAVPVRQLHAGVSGTAVYPRTFPLPRS